MIRKFIVRAGIVGLIVAVVGACSAEEAATSSQKKDNTEDPYTVKVDVPPASTHTIEVTKSDDAAPVVSAPDNSPPDVSIDESETKSVDSLKQAARGTGESQIALVANQASDKVENIVQGATNKSSAALQDAALKQEAMSDKVSDLKPDVVEEGDDSPFTTLVGDAAKGARLYNQCVICHAKVAGKNGVGPSLFNIVGRQAGTVEGFNYSPANSNADFIWTEDALFAFIENPREYLPGTRMTFAGVSDEQKRADIVEYIKTLTQ